MMKKMLIAFILAGLLPSVASATKQWKCNVTAATNSEIQKQKCLDAAGVKENAAEIIRDQNGKVVEVRVNLSDSASDTASAAVASNSGVSVLALDKQLTNVATYDGSDLPQNLGWTQTILFNPPSTTTTPGRLTMACDPVSGAFNFYQKTGIMAAATGVKHVMKLNTKYTVEAETSIAPTDSIQMIMHIDDRRVFANVAQTTGTETDALRYVLQSNETPIITNRGEAHGLDLSKDVALELHFDGNSAKLYIGGTERTSIPVVGTTFQGVNNLAAFGFVSFNSTQNCSVELDQLDVFMQ